MLGLSFLSVGVPCLQVLVVGVYFALVGGRDESIVANTLVVFSAV